MVLDTKFFEAMSFLAPKCPGCGTELEYGANTSYNQKKGCHACNRCGTELK
ncbi:hypothetical protein GF351_04895 [Candidatus Woesearchaeota archaeon]|nr:hypothetical protein [Candidatus Woesearchaeota archaeon]